MRRAQLHRAHIRRAGGPGTGGAGGVTSISFNGGPALSGALAIRSPMLADIGASPVRIDNGNVKELVEAAPVTGIDVDLNQSFDLTLSASRTLAIPTNSILPGPRRGEKITFTFRQAGDSSGNGITFTGGAGGYKFATAGSPAPAGVTLAQYQAVEALAAAANNVWKLGFEYDEILNAWLAVALAGPFI